MFAKIVKTLNLTKNFKEKQWQFQREETLKQEEQKEEHTIKSDYQVLLNVQAVGHIKDLIEYVQAVANINENSN